MPEPTRPFKRVRKAFNPTDLKRVCEMHETEFAARYGMQVTFDTPQHAGEDYPLFHAFKDNGSNVLAVAHLDTVVDHGSRTTTFVDTRGGPVVHSGALDDRLGAYTFLELLPKMGITLDWLLTTGEETGNSTAEFFTPPKEYNWVIEFDRGGTDVVLYQYEDGPGGDEAVRLVKDTGARVGVGAFSDISYMDHLEVKCFNWGVGYQDYHSVRGHAYLEDYWAMIAFWVKFYETNAEVYLPHENDGRGMGGWGRGARNTTYWWAREEELLCENMECQEPFMPYHTGQVYCDDCEWALDDRNFIADDAPLVEDLPDISEFEDHYSEVVSEDPSVVSKALARMEERDRRLMTEAMPGRSLN